MRPHQQDRARTSDPVLCRRSIELVRTLTTAGTLKKDMKAASAYAKLDPKGDVRLFVSSDLELDYYEVAIALCRLLLSKQRPNDALLFMTILSTTLKNLKRRGFNVNVPSIRVFTVN